MVRSEPAPAVSVPGVSPGVSVPMNDGGSPVSAAPYAFNPDAPALAPDGGVRYSPTRPGTAAASTLIAQPGADVLPASVYVVKSGDSLWTIAKRNHLTVGDLAATNNLKTSAPLHEGQKLLIPSKAAAALPASATATPGAAAGATVKSAETAAKSGGNSVKHRVKAGETLGTIARKYGVKPGEIAVANNITDPQKIYADMELVIPGWQAPGGKAAAKPASSSAAKNAEAAKPVVPEIKPLFNPPGSSATPEIGPASPSTTEVPVIKVDESPAPVKP
jgi:LysM repeat protein